MIKIKTLIIAVIILSQTVWAQNTKPYFGWDLSYESVLEKNKVDRREGIWKWLKFTYKKDYDPDYETPAKKWISEWKGEPIISSVVIDYPAFHAAEHTTMWFFRTKDKAYYWEYIDESSPQLKKIELKPEVYDKIYQQMSSWEQYKPLKPKETHPDDLPGFIGFLSSYEKDKSRQILLTRQDFMICETKDCDKRKLGRIFVALEPIL